MEREIYEVNAKIVDANGTYSTLSGYPVSFDSRNYNNDLEKTLLRAEGAFHECYGAMCKRDDRKLQTVFLLRMSDGVAVESLSIGTLIEPDPNPEPEE